MKCFSQFAYSALFLLLLSSILTAKAQVSTISQAEQDLEDAFVAVRSAEQAGANTTLLTSKLEEAGSVLAEARYELYNRNNSSGAELLINQSLTLSNEIKAQAVSLGNSAKSERANRLYWTAAASNLGLSLLVVFGFVGYRYLSRWYVRRLRRMTPKVADLT